MNYTPEQSRRLRIDAIRASYDRDPRIRCIRSRMLQDFAAGDALMEHHKFASPELTAYLNGIARAYR